MPRRKPTCTIRLRPPCRAPGLTVAPRLTSSRTLARLLAGGQLSGGRTDLPARQRRCCASRCGPSTSSPGCSGHWGTSPGLNFVYAHLNRVINRRGANLLYVCGPGHGGPAMVANAWLEGTYSELYSHVSRDGQGMARLFRQFSFPGGIPSHAAPETPGSINEGGELGYGLAHAYGAAFDNPELVVACVVGDGEAETGALATSWHANKFLDPVGDGAVLPILHLNGYKIANPTVLARIPDAELSALFTGYGYRPCGGAGWLRRRRPDARASEDGRRPRRRLRRDRRRSGREARSGAARERPAWPMIILRTPKGWTGPRFVDGVAGRRDVAGPSGAPGGGPDQPGPPGAARRMDAQLPARGALRRGRPSRAADRGARPCRRPPHERLTPRQRRRAPA